MSSDDAFDPYSELQLAPDAEPELVKAAFKALAKKYHPDRFSDPAEKARAEARMARINEAQKLLQSGGYRPPAKPPVRTEVTPPPPPTAPPRPAPSSRTPTIRPGPFILAGLCLLIILVVPGLLGGNHLEQALRAEKEGKLQESLQYLNEAVADDPHNRELYRHRARIWEKLGEPERAAVDRKNAEIPTLNLDALESTPSPHQVPAASPENPETHVP